MLSKLIKHEFRSTGRIFLFVYIAVIVMTIVNLLVPWESFITTDYYGEDFNNAFANIMMSIVAFLYGASIVVAIVVTLVVNIARFYKNLLGDEGYLMFTLPVTKDQLIISKLVVALVWNVGTYLLIFLSAFAMLGRYDLFAEISEALKAAESMGFNVGLMITLLVLAMLIGTIGHIIMLYTAIAVGPNLLKNRLGGSVIAYIIIYVIVQIMSTVSIVISGVFVRQSSLMFDVPPSTMTDLEGVNMLFNYCVGVVLVIGVIVAVVGYIITRFMLNKKLNLA